MASLRSRLFAYLLALFLFMTAVHAAKPSSFCKCTCFSNSTIIELRPVDTKSGALDIDKRSSSSSTPFASFPNLFRRADDDDDGGKDHKGKALTCNDCTRKFCLDYNLPKCKGATEDDVFTTCFQRDSTKDEIVVVVFIATTSALLIWAVMKPWVEKWLQAAEERRRYIPLSSEQPNTPR
ncbi:hypothetical protein VTN49DRAFT_172 [Thermomyces lanuginosus]|uniref:uncharacterized protein n=1 Tax=Thermomyces lanuginosus TaxID=5541 RepID=UPI003743F009